MTIEEFGKSIKTKYPQYNDINDIELGQKILTQYPQYNNMISGEQKSQPTPTIQQKSYSLLERLSGAKTGTENTLGNVGAGIIKGLGSTAVGLGQLGLKGASLLPFSSEMKQSIQRGIQTGEELKQNELKPHGMAQNIGFGGEQIGEFLLPVGSERLGLSLASKSKTGTKLDNVLQLTGKSLGVGTEFAGKTALQTGGNIEDIKRAGITGAITPPIFSGIKKTLPTIGEITSGTIAQMIGKSPEHVKTIFKDPIKAAKAIARKITPSDVRDKAINSLNQYRTSIGDDFTNGLNAIQENSKNILPFTQKPVKDSVKIIVNDTTKGIPKIFRDMYVGVNNVGKLNFNRSSIVKGGEQKNLQAVYDTIKNQKDFSPKGMQGTAARINALSKFTEGAKEESSVIISRIHNLYSKAIENTYPELNKLRSTYSTEIEIANGIDSILKSIKNDVANPTTVTGVVKKLSNLFAEDNDAYLKALKTLESKTGTDLLTDLAATEFQTYLPKGRLGSVIFQSAALAGGLLANPLIFTTLPLFSPKLEGKIITTTGRLSPLIKKLEQVIPRTIFPLINR